MGEVEVACFRGEGFLGFGRVHVRAALQRGDTVIAEGQTSPVPLATGPTWDVSDLRVVRLKYSLEEAAAPGVALLVEAWIGGKRVGVFTTGAAPYLRSTLEAKELVAEMGVASVTLSIGSSLAAVPEEDEDEADGMESSANGEVVFIAKDGKGLPNMDFGKQDPYVVVDLLSPDGKTVSTGKTGVVNKGGSSPKWSPATHDTVRLPYSGVQDSDGWKLRVTVWDKDLTSDDFVGKCTIDAEEYIGRMVAPEDVTLSLTSEKGDKAAGILHVALAAKSELVMRPRSASPAQAAPRTRTSGMDAVVASPDKMSVAALAAKLGGSPSKSRASVSVVTRSSPLSPRSVEAGAGSARRRRTEAVPSRSPPAGEQPKASGSVTLQLDQMHLCDVDPASLHSVYVVVSLLDGSSDTLSTARLPAVEVEGDTIKLPTAQSILRLPFVDAAPGGGACLEVDLFAAPVASGSPITPGTPPPDTLLATCTVDARQYVGKMAPPAKLDLTLRGTDDGTDYAVVAAKVSSVCSFQSPQGKQGRKPPPPSSPPPRRARKSATNSPEPAATALKASPVPAPAPAPAPSSAPAPSPAPSPAPVAPPPAPARAPVRAHAVTSGCVVVHVQAARGLVLPAVAGPDAAVHLSAQLLDGHDSYLSVARAGQVSARGSANVQWGTGDGNVLRLAFANVRDSAGYRLRLQLSAGDVLVGSAELPVRQFVDAAVTDAAHMDLSLSKPASGDVPQGVLSVAVSSECRPADGGGDAARPVVGVPSGPPVPMEPQSPTAATRSRALPPGAAADTDDVAKSAMQGLAASVSALKAQLAASQANQTSLRQVTLLQGVLIKALTQQVRDGGGDVDARTQSAMDRIDIMRAAANDGVVAGAAPQVVAAPGKDMSPAALNLLALVAPDGDFPTAGSDADDGVQEALMAVDYPVTEAPVAGDVASAVVAAHQGSPGALCHETAKLIGCWKRARAGAAVLHKLVDQIRLEAGARQAEMLRQISVLRGRVATQSSSVLQLQAEVERLQREVDSRPVAPRRSTPEHLPTAQEIMGPPPSRRSVGKGRPRGAKGDPVTAKLGKRLLASRRTKK